tara:strand:+ start:427 stop:1830 length:1404 start_codon:yes stop_codon:yes gene_type:complete
MKDNPYLCAAPWTHTYVSPQGERRLCCASREKPNFQRQYLDVDVPTEKRTKEVKVHDSNHILQFDSEHPTLEEHWNSEYMKDIRRRLLKGEKIPHCQVCNDQVLNLHTYRKYFNETLFPHKLDDIIAKTHEDGHYDEMPVSYDYRVSNLCNFKCRMCGEQLSSSWEAEKKKHEKPDFLRDPWLEPNNRQKINNFQKDVLEKELLEAVDNKTIEEIYWVGGEPLMWDIHWEVMQRLVITGHCKDVTIRYNTNLHRTRGGFGNRNNAWFTHQKEVKWKNVFLYDILPKFKSVNICASIDGAGDVGEYIREGLVWKEWLQNFKDGLFLIDRFGDDAMVFDVTLTTPGLFDLKRLFDTVTELDVKSYFKFTYAFDPSVVMSPMCLPRHVKEPIINELLEYMEPRLTEKTQVYKDSLLDLLERKSFDQEYITYQQGLQNGKRYQEHLDTIRNTKIKFRDTLNDVAKEWWDAI